MADLMEAMEAMRRHIGHPANLMDELRLSYEAARLHAPAAWIEAYRTYWATVHPCPAPQEDGKLQAGDRVRVRGEQGAVEGPAVITWIGRDDSIGRPVVRIEYRLVEPFDNGDGSQKLGAATIRGAVVHERDWPLLFVGLNHADPDVVFGGEPMRSDNGAGAPPPQYPPTASLGPASPDARHTPARESPQ